MTSPENFGPQFKDYIQAYRGLRDVAPHEVNLSNLGMHWSTNSKVAESFADDVSDPENPGTVVGALVHPNDVLRPGHPQYKDAEAAGFAGEDSPEDELPVRKGAPVYLTSMQGRWENKTEDSTPGKFGTA